MSGHLNGNGNGNGAGRTRVPLLSAVVLRTQSDPRLMQLASTGNEAAIDVLLQRYRKPLLQYCTRLIDPARAEDIVQQTFEKAIAQLRGQNRILHIKPWLYRVVHNDAIDVMRQTARFYPLDDQSESRLGSPEQLEGRQQLRTAIKEIDNLPPRQRSALLLREMEGRSFEEIAAELDSSVEGVYQLLRRARQQLRDKAAALLPLPLVRWMSGLGSHGATERVGEVAVGAGGAAAVAKVGAVVLTVSAIAVGVTNTGDRAANFAGPNGGGSGTQQIAAAPAEGVGATPNTSASSGGATAPAGDVAPAGQSPTNGGSKGPGGGGRVGDDDAGGGGSESGQTPAGAGGDSAGAASSGEGSGRLVAAKASAYVDAGQNLHVAFDASSGFWSVNGVDGGYTVRDEQGGAVEAGPGCAATASNELSCAAAVAPSQKTTALLYGTDASDKIAVSATGAGDSEAIKVAFGTGGSLSKYSLHGGAGDDELHGGARGAILGEDGDDIVSAADVARGTNLHLSGGPGDDRLFGGWGPDLLDGNAGADTLDGGGGRDRYVTGHMEHLGEADTIDAKDGGMDMIACADNSLTVESSDPRVFDNSGGLISMGDSISPDCLAAEPPADD